MSGNGDVFSTYPFGTTSPGGHSGPMNFTVGEFAQGHTLDTSMYTGAAHFDSGVDLTSEQDYRLFMEQQPQIGLATDKEKDRKPIDPPPVIRIEVSPRKDPRGVYLSNPYCFMICHLKKITKDESGAIQEEIIDGNKMSGSIVSSLHRLRNTENRDVGYFVFADMYPKEPGEYRLLFTLYEMARQGPPAFVELATIESAMFPVWPIKSFPGLKQSTYLTRAISDQGVRVRLRKDSRQSLSNRRKRHMSLTGAEDGTVWQQPRRHPTAPQMGGSPTTRPMNLTSATRTARSSHSISPTQPGQRHTSLGFTVPGHAQSSIAASVYEDGLSGISNSQPSRDRNVRLNNGGLRLPTPQGQSQFLTTPPPTARMGNANFYTFSSNPVLNQGPCYSSAETGTISTILPLHHQHHHHHQGH